MSITTLVALTLLAACSKSRESSSSTSTSTKASGSAAVAPISPTELCDTSLAFLELQPPPKKMRADCIERHATRLRDHPDRYTCETKCGADATDYVVKSFCEDACDDPKVTCTETAEGSSKKSCLERFGRVVGGEVGPKGYACVTKCRDKLPEDCKPFSAMGIAKLTECLGTDCGL